MEFTITTTAIGNHPIQTVNAREVDFDDKLNKFVEQHGPIGAGSLLLEGLCEVQPVIGIDMAIRLLKQLKNSGHIPVELIRVCNSVEWEFFTLRTRHGRGEKRAVKEVHIQSHFFKNIEHYLVGANRVDVRLFHGSIPDGFVSINGAVAPVEVKLDVFGERALAQRLGYMRRYESSQGVAVAQRCKANLPDNVIFVPINISDVAAMDESETT